MGGISDVIIFETTSKVLKSIIVIISAVIALILVVNEYHRQIDIANKVCVNHTKADEGCP